jgi:MAF protein
LVLASASPRRRELLGALGVPFSVRPSNIGEAFVEGRPVVDQAEALALSKAAAGQAVRQAPGFPNGPAVVLGADTVVVLDAVPLGKPGDAEEARRMLRSLRGRPHEVITGVAVVCGAGQQTAHAATMVHMRHYTDAEIDAYIAGGDPFDKAGAYAIQHAGFAPVERIDGCYCNVMGLPLWTVRRLLAYVVPDLATRPPSDTYTRCAACPLG